MTPPRPLPAAEKQRRYRERQKRGCISVRVDVEPGPAEVPSDRGLLRAWDSEDAERLKAVLEGLHQSWAESVTG